MYRLMGETSRYLLTSVSWRATGRAASTASRRRTRRGRARRADAERRAVEGQTHPLAPLSLPLHPSHLLASAQTLATATRASLPPSFPPAASSTLLRPVRARSPPPSPLVLLPRLHARRVHPAPRLGEFNLGDLARSSICAAGGRCACAAAPNLPPRRRSTAIPTRNPSPARGDRGHDHALLAGVQPWRHLQLGQVRPAGATRAGSALDATGARGGRVSSTRGRCRCAAQAFCAPDLLDARVSGARRARVGERATVGAHSGGQRGGCAESPRERGGVLDDCRRRARRTGAASGVPQATSRHPTRASSC